MSELGWRDAGAWLWTVRRVVGPGRCEWGGLTVRVAVAGKNVCVRFTNRESNKLMRKLYSKMASDVHLIYGSHNYTIVVLKYVIRVALTWVGKPSRMILKSRRMWRHLQAFTCMTLLVSSFPLHIIKRTQPWHSPKPANTAKHVTLIYFPQKKANFSERAKSIAAITQKFPSPFVTHFAFYQLRKGNNIKKSAKREKGIETGRERAFP